MQIQIGFLVYLHYYFELKNNKCDKIKVIGKIKIKNKRIADFKNVSLRKD